MHTTRWLYPLLSTWRARQTPWGVALWPVLLTMVVAGGVGASRVWQACPAWGAPAASAAAPSPAHAMALGWDTFQRGDLEQAAVQWQEAARVAADRQQAQAEGVALTRLAAAYEALGYHDQARQSLHTALRRAEDTADRRQMARILSHLSHLAAATGERAEAEVRISHALALAGAFGDAALTATILHTRGNLFMAQQTYAEAQQAYRDSATLARQAAHPGVAARALAHAALAAEHGQQPQHARTLLEDALTTLRHADPSHDTAYDLLLIGRVYHRLAGDHPLLVRRAAEVWYDAAHLAQQLQDPRAVSYAWGFLGSLYAEEGRLQDALELTRRAVLAASQVNAPESLYLWQWQVGRLLHARGDLEPAIAAYERAIALLQTIRPALLRAAGRGVLAFQSVLVPERRGGRTVRRTEPQEPLAFREAFGPLYFALADLLLRRAATLETSGQALASAQYTAALQQARVTVEQFKTAELRDYFGDECVAVAQPRLTALEQVAPDVAIVYPILLADRTELLVSLPGGLKRVALPIPGPVLEQQVRSFRAAVERQDRPQYMPLARDLYTWLIHPLAGDLTAGQIGTIVLVPDGALRALPLAALHDGQQFLIQKYALAVTPSLVLTEPHPLPRDRVHVLAAGVTHEVAGFPALPYVQAELDSLRQRYGGVVLLNQEFSPERLDQTLQQEDFGIVHIASHGHFAATAAHSFLLTGQGKLTLERFAQLVGRLRFRARPLELLTLSACDTAQGDDRAALGLAGVAIQAGARSALASLWAIADDATAELMRVFYTHLHTPGVSKAQALQRAQLALLQQPPYAEPVFWAPFLLLNNWL